MELTQAYNRGLNDIKGRLMGSHQHQALKWALGRELNDGPKGGVLALDMGLGKTYVMTALLKANPKRATLIIVPISIIHQWRDILSSFGGFSVLLLDRQTPLHRLPEETTVVITGYPMFSHKPRKGFPTILRSTKWNRILLDEGHLIKNTKGSTFNNLNKFCADIKWVVSATPVQNCMRDLDAPIQWIGCPKNHKEFKDEFLLKQSMEQVGANNPRMQLPKLESQIVKLDFGSSEEQALYASVEKDFAIQIEKTKKGTTLTSAALEGILRCRQACSHPEVCLDFFKRRKRKVCDGVESTKYKYVCTDLLTHKKEKAIVFCIWTNEIHLLMNYLNKNGVSAIKFDGKMSREQREVAISNFTNTDIRVLIIQINAGGLGLNLQAATRVYIISPTWNPCQELQAIARSHRLGQENIVKCFRLVIKDTVEDRITYIQDKKLALISDCFDDTSVVRKMGSDILALLVS